MVVKLLLFLFRKATALPQQNMSEFSVDPSLKYPYPAQWLFKIFVFKCMFKIWHKTAPFSTRSIVKPRKCRLTPTFRKASLAQVFHYKPLQTFITIIWELHSVVLKPICKEFIFPVSKIGSVLVLYTAIIKYII